METISNELPPEIWSHILSYVVDLDDLINLKAVNTLFYKELSAVDLIKAVRAFLASIDRSIDLSDETLKHFITRDLSYKLPRETLLHGLKNNMVPTIDGKTVLFKCIFLGKEFPGISIFLRRLAKGDYIESTHATIGVDHYPKSYVDPDGVSTKFQLWDTATTNSFVRVIRTYLKGRNAIFVCFSIDNRASFVNVINGWLPEISSANRQLKPEQQPLMYLLGFRSDLEDQRQVSTKEAKAVARALKLKYFECSSKLNRNVNEVMEELKNDLLATIRLSMNASNAKTDASESKRWCLVQ